ncbi:MAG: DUF167 domain-containing protein [Ruegeria sp.]
MAKPKLRNLPNLTQLAQPGQTIRVRVTPKAAQDRIDFDGDIVHIAVTIPPADGKANQAVIKVLAKAMRVAPSSLMLKQGHTGRDKLFVYDP